MVRDRVEGQIVTVAAAVLAPERNQDVARDDEEEERDDGWNDQGLPRWLAQHRKGRAHAQKGHRVRRRRLFVTFAAATFSPILFVSSSNTCSALQGGECRNQGTQICSRCDQGIVSPADDRFAMQYMVRSLSDRQTGGWLQQRVSTSGCVLGCEMPLPCDCRSGNGLLAAVQRSI